MENIEHQLKKLCGDRQLRSSVPDHLHRKLRVCAERCDSVKTHFAEEYKVLKDEYKTLTEQKETLCERIKATQV